MSADLITLVYFGFTVLMVAGFLIFRKLIMGSDYADEHPGRARGMFATALMVLGLLLIAGAIVMLLPST